MIKIACVGFAGMLLAGLLKHSHSPYAELISLAASLLIIFCTLTKLASVFEMLERLREYVSMQEGYFRILLKIIGITYVADFSSSICLDAGYKADRSLRKNFCPRCEFSYHPGTAGSDLNYVVKEIEDGSIP